MEIALTRESVRLTTRRRKITEMSRANLLTKGIMKRPRYWRRSSVRIRRKKLKKVGKIVERNRFWSPDTFSWRCFSFQQSLLSLKYCEYVSLEIRYYSGNRTSLSCNFDPDSDIYPFRDLYNAPFLTIIFLVVANPISVDTLQVHLRGRDRDARLTKHSTWMFLESYNSRISI